MIRLVALASLAAAALVPGPAAAQAPAPQAQQQGTANCTLSNGIKHVISIQFDNVHLTRDRANAPSDLEQMPNLLNFMTSNGTLSDNEHTILISHTAGGILSSLTGLYPDRMGITVSNSYGYFKTGTNATAFSSAFKYWTDKVDDVTANGVNDPLPNMVTTGGLNTPAPWVAYTRAGCDYGATSTANVVLENTKTTPAGDMTKVFGAGSPEWNEAAANAPLAQTDFVGIAIHCAQGGGICNSSTHARQDLLPDEPGGYAGFKGLFGAKYVNPAITGGANVVNDTSGNPITDPAGNPGFPGFDGMLAKRSLGYVAQMQEAGVPVTFAYISDAHDNHSLFRASGPGEADYMAQLQAYDQAFGTFFNRLAADGINKSNTLFVFTSDENDHFAGGNSTDGTWTHAFCNVTPPAAGTCPANQIGEVTQNIKSLVPASVQPASYDIHFDSAPTVYVAGNPDRTNPTVRHFEQALATATAVDPYVSSSPTSVMLRMADPVGQKALHMVNADPQRTPTFTYFANPDYFLTTTSTNCPDAAHKVPTCVDYHFAYSHGDVTEDIGRTWLGFVGPGVKSLGRTSNTWSDHSDIRPTILALLGLRDSYEPDGAALVDFLDTSAVSRDLRAHHESLVRLHIVYKQIAAPFGPFAADTLVASTRATSSTEDTVYSSTEQSIATLTQQRDDLEAQMRTALTNATFGGQLATEQDLKKMIDQGQQLLADASSLAAAS